MISIMNQWQVSKTPPPLFGSGEEGMGLHNTLRAGFALHSIQLQQTKRHLGLPCSS